MLCLIAFCHCSCENWLDVKPRQQIEADVLFSRQDGFKDALYAIYINMSSEAMYGSEMTFGLVDVLGGVYPTVGENYTYAQEYEYDRPFVEGLVNAAWQKSYNTIVQINNLIDNLHKADKGMFSPDNYNVILGEALGLRAFIHFDLLRLFAPSYKVNPNAIAIPYVTKYGFHVTPQYTVSAVMDSVMRDATTALALLKESDPIYTGRDITTLIDDGYLLNRQFNLNYYALKALMSRVHMYRGQLSEAAACAEEVINSGIAQWVQFASISNANPESRDRTFTPEQLFVLNITSLDKYVNTRLRVGYIKIAGGNYPTRLAFPSASLNALYPDIDDWRRRFLFIVDEDSNSADGDRWCIKLGGIGATSLDFRTRLPMIRLPEMYLTLAEALVDTNPVRSAALLNELALNRGISGGIVASDSPASTIREVIYQEYCREFPCEGQMFYYHKRLDLPSIAGGSTLFDKSKYVLWMPQEEIEFGQRK